MKTKMILFILLLTGFTLAKDFFYVDYSCFRTAEDSKTRTDIYISIPIIYLEFDKELTSLFSMKVFVYDGEKLVAEDIWKQKYRISNIEDKYSGAEIPVMSKLELPPGYYRLVVEVDDLNTGKKIDVLEVPQESKMFMIAAFEEKFSISTVQLASRIITDDPDEKSEFFKQGVIILPNPSKIFGTSRPFLYYYAEIYGLDAEDEIGYRWIITSTESGEVKNGEISTKKAPGKTLALADRISIPGLKTGSYDLILEVTNKTSGKVIEAKNNFYMYRKIDFIKQKYRLQEDEITTSLQRDSIEIDIMKDDDISLEYDQVFSILDKKEQNMYSGLVINGKREFLKKYWTEQETKQENARDNFKALLAKINAEFSTKNSEGWKTDRGRVYLKFGPPNRRDIETYSTEYEDHEIWSYFTGGYTFVFADEHGLGDFKLIHTDYQGEKYDPNWQSKIQKSKY